MELGPSLPQFMPFAARGLHAALVPVMTVAAEIGPAGTVLASGSLTSSGHYIVEQLELEPDEGGGESHVTLICRSAALVCSVPLSSFDHVCDAWASLQQNVFAE